MPEIGDRFKSILTGATYEVEKIKDKMVVLEREDKKSRVLTELSNLKLFYKREEKEEEESKPRYGIVNFEKRRYPRFSVDLPMEYTWGDLVAKQGRVTNVSESGLLVYCADQMEIGQALRLKLFLPFGSELNMMEIVNKVVWMDVYKGKELGDYRSGVKFAEISPVDVDKLKSFLVSLPQGQYFKH